MQARYLGFSARWPAAEVQSILRPFARKLLGRTRHDIEFRPY